MFGLSAWRRRRALRNPGFTPAQWAATVTTTAPIRDWAEEPLERLRELAIHFLHAKTYTSADTAPVDDGLRLRIAALACVPVLRLGVDYYSDWIELIVYPDVFVARRDEVDEAGVVHHVRRPLVGEAWSRGPVVLSRADIEDSAEQRDGFNVVIHEMAHKLDMLNGDANGFPPLHRGMSARDWARHWSAAYDDFGRRVDAGEDTRLDPYAAEDPAEFFAVMSEAFFETPEVVEEEFPEVYRQLQAFYRLDPRRLDREV